MEKLNVIRLSQPKLKQVVESSHTATVVMMFFALRQRARAVTNLNGLRAQLLRMGEKIVDDDYIKFWQNLEAEGIGQFIVGRRGNPDRFKWHYDLKEIATSAIDGSKDAEVKQLAKKKETVKAMPIKRRRRRSKKSLSTGRVLVEVALENGNIAEIILPKNASKQDYQTVCNALIQ